MQTRWARNRARVQSLLSFLERRERLDRAFRWAIVAMTLLGLAGVWLAMADGRAGLVAKARRAKWAAPRGIGLEPDRAEVDADWADRRERRGVRTREVYRRVFEKMPSPQKALLRAAGVAPDDAVVRWGNYDRTFVLSSRVFEDDEGGRSYRFRPSTRSFFLRQIVEGLDTCQFFLPDTPEVRRLAAGAGLALPAEGSQSINAWGCRGPEPDLDAPVRVLVLGDSFMQGYLFADDETPPMHLQRALRQVSNITAISSESFIDPTDQFVTEHLRINLEEGRKGKPHASALYNEALGDPHLSARGAALWGRIVARRLALLIRARKKPAGRNQAGR